MSALAKLMRFSRIYGPGRTFYKATARLRVRIPTLSLRRKSKDIGVIGCGQFAYSTIGYFLRKAYGARIAACYDIDIKARDTFGRAFGVPARCASPVELLVTPGLRTVFIASNHATHTPYAIQALARGVNVYIEKPIAVSRSQLITLLKASRFSNARMFAGYNRPYSAAIRELRERIRIDPAKGFTLQCFVVGHLLTKDHWYRHPEEGTRVCGNIGHWLDLMVHILSWRGLPSRLDISVAYADTAEPDDNICISITSERGDIFSVMLSSRCEPFEGINESINIQHGETICKIDDFRQMTIWQGARIIRRKYWPKDVGHRLAVLQPFSGDKVREWHEVELSTLLMLHIADMVRARQRESSFSIEESWAQLLREVGSE